MDFNTRIIYYHYFIFQGNLQCFPTITNKQVPFHHFNEKQEPYIIIYSIFLVHIKYCSSPPHNQAPIHQDDCRHYHQKNLHHITCLLNLGLFHIKMRISFTLLLAKDLHRFLLITKTRIFKLSYTQGVHTQVQCTLGTNIFST